MQSIHIFHTEVSSVMQSIHVNGVQLWFNEIFIIYWKMLLTCSRTDDMLGIPHAKNSSVHSRHKGPWSWKQLHDMT